MVCGGTIMTQYGKYKYIKLYQNNNLIYGVTPINQYFYQL